jgi:SAM-dependent methyltransferase
VRAGDAQTRRSFSDKWSKNPSMALAQTLDPKSPFQTWILARNGFRGIKDAEARLAGYRRILDAGCGNGRVTALLASLAPAASVTAIDLVDLAAARRNTAKFGNVELRRVNLRRSLRGLGRFDFIYCQEVLHHTGDAARGFRNLAAILAPGGKLAIYVYRRKAPARELMDDHVRNRIAGMSYEEAMKVCRQITELGRRLAEVKGEIEVDDIPALGIEKGRYTPQRLLYNFFLKCYWNDVLSYEENAVVNYDWYHPQHCSRHTREEVEGWFAGEKLKVTWRHEDLYGITMHGVRV